MWFVRVCIPQLYDACLSPSCQLPVASCQWFVRQRQRPQGLKPALLLAPGGTAEAVPFPKPLPLPKIYRSLSPYIEAGNIWFEVGPGTALPCSSIFIPRLSPIEERISLISLSDLRPKFFVFSISASVFWTNSPMV